MEEELLVQEYLVQGHDLHQRLKIWNVYLEGSLSKIMLLELVEDSHVWEDHLLIRNLEQYLELN